MGRRMICAATLACVIFSTSGCATILAKQPAVNVNSNPTGAQVLVDDRVVGNTPLRIEVDPKKVEAITLRQEGCDDITVPLTRSTGAGWVILDILTGLVPVVIDAITGKWTSLNPKDINAQLCQ